VAPTLVPFVFRVIPLFEPLHTVPFKLVLSTGSGLTVNTTFTASPWQLPVTGVILYVTVNDPLVWLVNLSFWIAVLVFSVPATAFPEAGTKPL
jgi:hypothetical protein